MYIQISTDNQLSSDRERDARLEDLVRQRLARFEQRITDVEIHVSNGNATGGADLKCTLEARINGFQPVAVTEHGASVDRAVMAAARTAVKALDHQLGRRNDRR